MKTAILNNEVYTEFHNLISEHKPVLHPIEELCVLLVTAWSDIYMINMRMTDFTEILDFHEIDKARHFTETYLKAYNATSEFIDYITTETDIEKLDNTIKNLIEHIITMNRDENDLRRYISGASEFVSMIFEEFEIETTESDTEKFVENLNRQLGERIAAGICLLLMSLKDDETSPVKKVDDLTDPLKTIFFLTTMLRAMKKDKQSKQQPAKGPGRNDPCPCGSGEKYKNCCLL